MNLFSICIYVTHKYKLSETDFGVWSIRFSTKLITEKYLKV